MFKSISSRIPLPAWMGSPESDNRFRRLTIFDIILDGKFYNHLPYDFYTEQSAPNVPVLLKDRRPSAQYRLPRYASRWVARKLFAGRHIPQVASSNKKLQTAIGDLLTQVRIWPTMFEAAYRGTVGSVAITFRLEKGKIGLNVWKAANCSPKFDDSMGDLEELFLHYKASSRELARLGFRDVEEGKNYWFLRKYGAEAETTFKPILYDLWNPINGDNDLLVVSTEMPPIQHNLGMVPAVWIANPGGENPDGACLWEDAMPNSIEIDYLMSQGARGTRYNSAPQLVTIGKITNMEEDGQMTRSPVQYLAFEAAIRQDDGTTIGGGDAKLLEMSGNGGKATLEIVEELKKMALEQIGLIQKDPSQLPGPLSGRAMEFLDEDSHDLAMQWRSTYGDGGVLPLIKKIVKVLNAKIVTDDLWLRWSRMYQPTPQDLVDITNALRGMVAPQAIKTSTGANGDNDMGDSVEMVPALLDIETGSAYLRANMDLTVIGNEDAVQHAGMAANAPLESGADQDTGMEIGFGPFYKVFPRINVSS